MPPPPDPAPPALDMPLAGHDMTPTSLKQDQLALWHDRLRVILPKLQSSPSQKARAARIRRSRPADTPIVSSLRSCRGSEMPTNNAGTAERHFGT